MAAQSKKAAESLDWLIREHKDHLIERGQFFELSVLVLSRSLRKVLFKDEPQEDIELLNKEIGEALGEEEWKNQSHLFVDFYESLLKLVPADKQSEVHTLLLEYLYKSVTGEE